MVLNPTALPNASKVKKLDDLASELGSEANSIRENEGEAANYGVYFDDTEYDYMQHMRDLGTGGGEVHFVEAVAAKNKGKAKQTLEDALRETSLDDTGSVVLDDEILPSKNLRKATYQAQQDIPDALAGFQPDMDPRLREVLEALEDEAYVDDDDEVFGKLAEDGQEIEEDEFEQGFWDDGDEEGWESDRTAKPDKEYKEPPTIPHDVSNDEREDHGDGDWMANFSKFKKDQKKVTIAPSDLQSSLMTTTTNGGRRKKRKGALTNPSNYSMTSSSVFRTEGLTILDDRFEKIDESYNEDMEDDMASISAASSMSSVQGPVRGDFDSIMDDFLGGYTMSGKKHVKKGKYQSGLEQLDEVRKGLGPARFRSQKT
jgi:protein LTV1